MRVRVLMLWAAAAMLAGGMPASAQVTTIDPNSAIDSDIDPPAREQAPPADDPPSDPYAAPDPRPAEAIVTVSWPGTGVVSSRS